MCSQPIVHDAQLLRATCRSPARSSAASAGRLGERRGLEVAGRQRADGVEGEQVGQRAELAVLGRGRPERARPQVARGGEHRLRVGRGDLGGGADRDGLEPLGAQHGAEAAAAGVAPVVGDRGVADAALARRADRGHPPAPAQPLAQPRLGLGGGQPPQVVGAARGAAPSPSTSSTDGCVARTAHDDGVVAGELARRSRSGWRRARR